jgi:hypothetical protein
MWDCSFKSHTQSHTRIETHKSATVKKEKKKNSEKENATE